MPSDPDGGPRRLPVISGARTSSLVERSRQLLCLLRVQGHDEVSTILPGNSDHEHSAALGRSQGPEPARDVFAPTPDCLWPHDQARVVAGGSW